MELENVKLRIFHNEEYNLFSTSISKLVKEKNKKGEWLNVKDKDGNNIYERMYVSVDFIDQNDTPENNTSIIIEGFMTFYTTKNDEQKLKIVVREWDEEEIEKPKRNRTRKG